jgi:hypothetical protein
MRRLRGTVFVAAMALLGLSAPARAEDASADRLRSAAEEYDRGRRAYLANDFEVAATHFENAFRDAPRAEPLRNAIRARLAAKQGARAATLAALAESEYPTDAATQELVKKTLAAAASQLQQVTIRCTPACSIGEGGKLLGFGEVSSARLFFAPGPHHLVISWSQDRSKMADFVAAPGANADLVFDAPAVMAVAPVLPPAVPKPAAPPPKPLRPWVFFTGAGLTLAAAGATVWSGLDAQSNPGKDAVRRDCVGLGESCATYQQGKDAEFRTNVLLGVSAGLAIGSGVVGLFFTQWGAAPKPSVGLFPGGGTVGVAGTL